MDPLEEQSNKYPAQTYRDLVNDLDEPDEIRLSMWEVGFLARCMDRLAPLTDPMKAKLEQIYGEKVMQA